MEKNIKITISGLQITGNKEMNELQKFNKKLEKLIEKTSTKIIGKNPKISFEYNTFIKVHFSIKNKFHKIFMWK